MSSLVGQGGEEEEVEDALAGTQTTTTTTSCSVLQQIPLTCLLELRTFEVVVELKN